MSTYFYDFSHFHAKEKDRKMDFCRNVELKIMKTKPFSIVLFIHIVGN